MTTETSNIDKDKTKLPDFLIETHREDLKEILAIGEKYKREGKEIENKFWVEYDREEFSNLIRGYKESEYKFIEGLEPEEKRIINRLNEIEKKKFINEYLKDRIIYSGDLEKEYENVENKYDILKNPDIESYKDGLKKRIIEQKTRLQPGMTINFYGNNITPELVEIIAKEWKNSLQPGISINLWFNEIGDEGVKILAKEWKDSLQPGMKIDLSVNDITPEGVEIIAKEWKNSLQPGMSIILGHNNIGDEGVKILAKEWKDNLQPGMNIGLNGNDIGDKGVAILVKEWKDSLQPGMEINLEYNKIGDEGVDEIMKLNLKDGVKIDVSVNSISANKKDELRRWEQGYKDNGINCEVKF